MKKVYKVEFSKAALRNIKKLDKDVAQVIVSWINKNLEGTDNPRQYGKPLKGALAKAWRYRVGDYRILCEIQDDKVVIIVIRIGHRREVYD